MTQEERDSLYEVYSDMYKDLHGFRPRGIDTSSWDRERFKKEFDEMQVVITEQIAQEKIVQNANIVAFEERVGKVIALVAGDRETALRWIHSSESTDGDDDYLCFVLNLPYGYIEGSRANG